MHQHGPIINRLSLYVRFNVGTYMAVIENGKIHMSYHTEHIKLHTVYASDNTTT